MAPVIEEECVLSERTLREILGKISFKPSCVDMGWEWEIAAAYVASLPSLVIGWHIRTTFRRPDRDSNIVTMGKGRWWLIDRGTSVSGVVKTAFAAAKMILEHELMESFKYDGERPFDPHNSIYDLIAIAKKEEEYMDAREEKPEE